MMNRATTSKREIAHYFEYTPLGIEAIEDGLKEMTFGEFLIEEKELTRYQLLRALQLQDKHPDIRLGECVAALGYLRVAEIEVLLRKWKQTPVVEL